MAKNVAKAQAGFDLTDISADNWELLLDLFDLTDAGWSPLYPGQDEYKDYGRFVFENEKLLIVTGNHPITGEYANKGRRDNEVGHASYIGIVGDKELVRKAFKAIKKLADSIKDESPNSRDFI